MALTDRFPTAPPLGGAALLVALLLAGGCKLSEVRPDEQVPQGYLRGRVDLRVWPLDRIGAVK